MVYDPNNDFTKTRRADIIIGDVVNSWTNDGVGNPITSTVVGPATGLDVNVVAAAPMPPAQPTQVQDRGIVTQDEADLTSGVADFALPADIQILLDLDDATGVLLTAAGGIFNLSTPIKCTELMITGVPVGVPISVTLLDRDGGVITTATIALGTTFDAVEFPLAAVHTIIAAGAGGTISTIQMFKVKEMKSMAYATDGTPITATTVGPDTGNDVNIITPPVAYDTGADDFKFYEEPADYGTGVRADVTKEDVVDAAGTKVGKHVREIGSPNDYLAYEDSGAFTALGPPNIPSPLPAFPAVISPGAGMPALGFTPTHIQIINDDLLNVIVYSLDAGLTFHYLYPGESLTKDNISPQPGDIELAGQAGGEFYRFQAW